MILYALFLNIFYVLAEPVKTIYNTLFLGTHDSGTHQLSSTIIPCNDHTDLIEKLVSIANVLHYNVTKHIVPWALSQSNTIKQQLSKGIRYIDLRLVYGKLNGVTDWYVQHSFVGDSIYDIFKTVLEQIMLIPDVYIIQMYICGLGDFKNLNTTIYKTFKEYLWYTDIDPSTFNIYQLNRSRIMIYSSEVNIIPSTFIWNSNLINETFPQTSNLSYMVEYNTRNINWFRSQNSTMLYKIAWVLTPDLSVIVKSVLEPLYPKSLIEFSNYANDEFIRQQPFINKELSCNIIVVDNYNKDYELSKDIYVSVFYIFVTSLFGISTLYLYYVSYLQRRNTIKKI